MWILILTLVTTSGGGVPPVMAGMSGFSSERACQKAGEDWLKQVHEMADHKFTIEAKALCEHG